jgi:hypothetical protein
MDLRALLTNEEFELLAHLVYLGNKTVNSRRTQGAKIKKYNSLAEKIDGLLMAMLLSEMRYPRDKELYYLENTQKYVDAYDEEGLFSLLAEKLAEREYPKTAFYAAAVYEQELNKKGVSIVSIRIPDMETRLKNTKQEIDTALDEMLNQKR